MKSIPLRKLLQCALFAALLCVCSPIAVPIGTIPITLGLFAVLLCGVVLPWKQSLVSVAVFLLLSLCGLPVFANGQAGLSALVGPTGGYISSYFIVAPLVSAVSRLGRNEKLAPVFSFCGCVLGAVVCYALGTLQFMLLMQRQWKCPAPRVPAGARRSILCTR